MSMGPSVCLEERGDADLGQPSSTLSPLTGRRVCGGGGGAGFWKWSAAGVVGIYDGEM